MCFPMWSELTSEQYVGTRSNKVTGSNYRKVVEGTSNKSMKSKQVSQTRRREHTHLYNLGSKRSNKQTILTVLFKEQPLKMEVGTGAALLLITLELQEARNYGCGKEVTCEVKYTFKWTNQSNRNINELGSFFTTLFIFLI